jgi:hypothetical protein
MNHRHHPDARRAARRVQRPEQQGGPRAIDDANAMMDTGSSPSLRVTTSEVTISVKRSPSIISLGAGNRGDGVHHPRTCSSSTIGTRRATPRCTRNLPVIRGAAFTDDVVGASTRSEHGVHEGRRAEAFPRHGQLAQVGELGTSRRPSAFVRAVAEHTESRRHRCSRPVPRADWLLPRCRPCREAVGYLPDEPTRGGGTASASRAGVRCRDSHPSFD